MAVVSFYRVDLREVSPCLVIWGRQVKGFGCVVTYKIVNWLTGVRGLPKYIFWSKYHWRMLSLICCSLQAFSTPWFLFSNATNHHLVFFLLEIFNNIIQYQFDGMWLKNIVMFVERLDSRKNCTKVFRK